MSRWRMSHFHQLQPGEKQKKNMFCQFSEDIFTFPLMCTAATPHPPNPPAEPFAPHTRVLATHSNFPTFPLRPFLLFSCWGETTSLRRGSKTSGRSLLSNPPPLIPPQNSQIVWRVCAVAQMIGPTAPFIFATSQRNADGD